MSKRTPRAILLYFSSSGLRPSIQFLTARSFSASSSLAPHSPHFFHSSSSSSPAPAQASWKHRNEEGSKSVRVTVWWDYENCPIPNGVNPYKVVQRITSALRAEGIRGPVSITAFADVQCLNRPCQEALFATGVSFNHVPRRGKNSSDKSILADLVYWVAQNPPPAHFLLISGDGDFTSMLHRLRLNNYNVLIATLNHTTSAFSSSATVLWYWDELLQGDRVAGKHFNQPPDGLYSSWYGQFKGSLEDPFYLDSEFAVSQPEECAKSPAVLKTHFIPKHVVVGIVESLACYPKGLAAKDLLIRLKKRNILVDNKFFGHGSFVDLISSLPRLVKTARSRNGRVVICKLKSLKDTLKTAESGVYKSEDEDEEGTLEKDETLSLMTSDPTKEEHHLAKDKKASHASPQSSPSEGSISVKTNTLPCMDKYEVVDTADKDMDSDKNIVHTEPLQTEDPGNSRGFFRRLWTALTGRYFNKVTTTSSGDSTSRKDEPLECTQVVGNELKTEPGFFSKLAMRINLKKTGAKETQMNEKCSRVVNETKSNQVKEEYEQQQQNVELLDLKPKYHELFSKDQFWESLESFLSTEKATEIVVKSMTRIDLVQGLQKEGPLVLSSLTTNNISYMINLLISEKWLEESSSVTPSFKLVYPTKRSTSDGLSKALPRWESLSNSQATQVDCDDEHGQTCIGISCNKTVGKIIPKNLSELKVWFQQVSSDNSSLQVEDFKDLYEKEFGRKLDSFFYGYFNTEKLLEACCGSREMKGKSQQLSRQQILTDCEKLVTESLVDNPAGIPLAATRAMFQERYGYSLDYKELSYPKLSSMLKLIPGVRVESNLILPASAPQQSGSNDDDFSWEELGPVKDSIDENDWNKESGLASELEFNELSTSDDEESLSDDDASRTREPNRWSGQGDKSRKGEEESSLVKILESWHKNKDSKENSLSQSVVRLVDCSEGGGEEPLPLESRPVSPLSSSFLGKRIKKTYTFVSDAPADKGKVANEMLPEVN